MVEYTCNRCLKTFDHKHNYIYHINRKRKCNTVKDTVTNIIDTRPSIKKAIKEKVIEIKEALPTNNIVFNKDKIYDMANKIAKDGTISLQEDSEYGSFTVYNAEFNEPYCVYCNKQFISNSHRNRHMNNNCDVRKRYIELIKILDTEMDNLYIENKFLRTKYMGLFGDNYLFPFGTEKFIGVDNTLIIDSIKNPYRGIPEFIKAYHFNPLEKRYNNIRITNPRGLHLEIFNGSTWVIETKENVIQSLIRTYKDIIDMEIENVTDLLLPVQIRNYNDFSEFADYYISFLMYDTELTPTGKKYAKNVYQKIYSAVELMIINTFRKDKEEIINSVKRKNEEVL